MITAGNLDDLLAVARKHGVKGATITDTSVEFVFESAAPPPKEKPIDEIAQDTTMPTRAEIEAARKRITEGGLK